MDNVNENLSKRLHEVLDAVGASEYTRNMHWELAMFHEISISFESQLYDNTSKTRSFYQVGSSCEGTTTPGLSSDIDVMYCYEINLVVDNLVESKQQGISYLILSDEFTKPGYVRLQRVIDQSPVSVKMWDVPEDRLPIDWKGQICFTHSNLTDGQNTSRNGPADTYPPVNGSSPIDVVYALRCRRIPKSATAWFHKKRKYDWPSQKQLRTMGLYDCFLVGVGHPHNVNKSFEWRISFSLQERFLMSSMNETQHKCYILLKMIKKDIIESKVGESISSYHCKTSLFYTIENSPRHIWKDGNLIPCARLCLIRISNWVKEKYCPNYFIPEENMFDKLSLKTLKDIEKVLDDIIYNVVTFLYSITRDNVGELLNSKLCGSELLCRLTNTSTMLKSKHVVLEHITSIIYEIRNEFLQRMHMSSNTSAGYLNQIKRLLVYLQNTNHVTEHTTRDIRMAFDSIIPHIQLQHEQSLFSEYVSRGDLSRLWFKTFPKVISESISDYDLISSKLALASLYIQFEELQEECRCILVACENSLKPYVISVCACQDSGFISNRALVEKLRFTDISSKDFKRYCTTGCMVFHLSQVALLHKALKYELFRTVYTKPDSEIEANGEYWLNWATIDSKIYLYFLQYLLYSKTQTMTEQETALRKLKHVLETDPNIGHKETGLNMFGWIRLQENDVPRAWRLFCLSWIFRPFRNAAKWHMLFLLSEVIKGT